MVESLQMFLFLFKSKYRRKFSWFSQFLCSVLIVLLFCHGVIARCSELNCVNGVCKNETCVCFEGWQGTECQYCGGKIMLTSPTGVITDGPGNYSVSTQCSWLLSPPWPGASPPPIRIRLESFATECGWDHLYIYDGDSVRATKLLAVFSGVLDPDDAGRTRQVVAHSGSALLHFFSDDAFAMEGFNVTYAVGSCPSDDHRTNCSSHGECDETNGSCRCDPEWKGTACDEPVCPEECNAKLSYGSCTQGGCQCVRGRAGVACERDVNDAGWDKLWSDIGEDDSVPRGLPPAAAGASLLNYNDDLLRVGGETFGDADFLYRYKVSEQVWRKVETVGPSPAARFAHSAIMYGHELIVYGGVVASDQPERGGGLAGLEGRSGSVTNEIWRIQLDSAGPQWSNMTPTNCSPHRQPPLRHCGGLHISGHTAVLTFLGATKKPVMLVFFGHSPHYGYLHLVQEYYIDEGVWSVANTKGWPARAGFGHTAAYDELSRKVYVHGGLVSESEASQAPSSALHEYDAESRVWRPLPSAPTPRYLHSAIFVAPGVMLVVGGNAHNDTAAAASAGPSGAQCYCQWGFLYHARCRTWTQISTPMALSRAMHSTAMLPLRDGKTAVVYGGFDGRLRSDAWTFTLGARCSSIDDATRCVAAPHCVWDLTKLMCLSIEEIGWKSSFDGSVKACNDEPIFDSRGCGAATSCGACAARGCAWCGACYAAHHFCVRHSRTAFTVEECGENNESLREVCGRYHSCAACHAHHHHHHNMHSSEEPQRACYWDYDTIKCKPANSSDDIRSVSGGPACSATCATLHTCANCTSEECIWCASAGRCVDKNAYGASFPLGGCRAWSTNSVSRACSAGAAAGCGGLATCAACRAEPACGWCDDGAGGGRGECMPGGGSAPHTKICAHRWHFTQCPACQCNGHSLCDEESRCMQPCAGRSVGAHCDTCAPGHWGSSLNGHHCQPCECNAQAVACAPDTGRCYCSTKGLAGDRCDKCDNTNHYHADIYNTKACYYDLAVDYQFTFNLSKKEDRHLSAINFRNAPVKPDVDADFTITCSAHARMNLTVRTRTDPTEKTLFSDVNCTNFRYKFLKSEHMFGIEHNVTLSTFFVYVYDFKPPLWIQISFSQYPKLNLQQFFITFSSCFLLLLLVAAALWKIKQKYDLYRRRQRLFVEMEQMASRPFSQVCVELEKGGGGTGVPAPVALEPCRGGRAAVLSLLVRLPTGGTGRAPPLGGLAVASALVTLGHHPTNNTKRPHH